MKKKCKYNRSDFAPLPVTLKHLNIQLNFLEGRVHAVNELSIAAAEDLTELRLDAQDLTVQAVEWLADDGQAQPLTYDYQQDHNILLVPLPTPVKQGDSFVLRTTTTCEPSDNILDGLYQDTTPPGCPQQYMSQCQQWGFQRIMPIFDDCRAKCTMRTTIEADARYTHLISNGNIDHTTNPDGKPVPVPGKPDRQTMTYDNPVPMAPYLFIVCVGTWDMLEDEVVYPSGKRIKLEYLVPPGRLDGAVIPMAILKSSVEWQGRTQDYEYRHDVYRTICMEKSNFGGMENVGNTTIVTSAALIDEWTSDTRLEYAYGVIIHEFEHNQCGSDVTMETPFDMWLNEAFTVDVERQYTMSQFNPACVRLDEVGSMRAPIRGPLAIEDAGYRGNIVREGFNDPDEVVDGVTYVKAAEVIRMLRLILGADVFRKTKNAYFAKHNGGNANTDDFFACFEAESGRDLSQFREQWLHSIGYPQLRACYDYNATKRELRVVLRQTRASEGGLFHFPFVMAAMDAEGQEIPGTEQAVEISEAETTLTFSDIPDPAFMSFNRDCSFYGTFSDETSGPEELRLQIRKDSNAFNRVEAMRQLTDLQRIALIDDPAATVDEAWLDLYHSLLIDDELPMGLKAYILGMQEASLDRRYLPYYRERYAARITLLKAVAARCLPDLIAQFNAVDTYRKDDDPREGVEPRHLKAALLRVLVEAGTPETHELAEAHFHRAWHISDRVAALASINAAGHPNRQALLAEAFEQWKDHLNAYTSYLMIVAGGVNDDVFDAIAREAERDCFVVQHPSHSRALYLPMGSNNKMMWTDRGIGWMTERVIELSPVNQNLALGLVSSFQLVDKLADDLQDKVRSALERMRSDVDAKQHPAVAGRLDAYLG